MNFQQMQHNEESDYEYDDDERSLQTDDLSYMSSSYDTENEDENDDDMSVKIGGNIMVDGEDLDEEEGEVILEGGVKMPFSRSSKPEYVVFKRPDESYKYLHNRPAFNKIMSFCLSQSEFKTLFMNYINGTDSDISKLNKNIQKYVKLQSTTDTNGTNAEPTILDKSDYFETGNNGIEKLYEIIYDNNKYNEALDIRNDKVYLSNKFAIELMFCLTHFINDGCPDINDTNVPNHQKFKRRYEYRELFVSFVKNYTKNKGIQSILVTQEPQKSDSDQQKIFMKYLLLLIAFESDNLVAPSMPGQKSFVKRFTIPDPSNATEFINMLNRIMNCFSIGEDIALARNIIKQFYNNVNLIVKEKILTDHKLTVSQWLKEHLLSTIEFYFYFSKTKKGGVDGIEYTTTASQQYFRTLKQEMYDKSKIIQYLSDDVDEINRKLQIKGITNTLFFLEYITGNKQASDTTGIYFYNHSLPIIPYESNMESDSITQSDPSSTSKGVSEPNLLNGYNS